jgi:hypothetical protein
VFGGVFFLWRARQQIIPPPPPPNAPATNNDTTENKQKPLPQRSRRTSAPPSPSAASWRRKTSGEAPPSSPLWVYTGQHASSGIENVAAITELVYRYFFDFIIVCNEKQAQYFLPFSDLALPCPSPGTIGHVAHGKSTVVKAISGVHTVRFKNELERNITIKLGYANAKVGWSLVEPHKLYLGVLRLMITRFLLYPEQTKYKHQIC